MAKTSEQRPPHQHEHQAQNPSSPAELINHAFWLLGRIVDQLETNSTSTDLAFGAAGMEEVIENWPTSGQRRRVVVSKQQGQLANIPATTYTDLLDADPGRGGLSIVNSGANGTYLYLARAGDAQQGGAGVLYIGALGTWDGRISGRLWAGAVSAYSPTGTTLAIATI